MERQRAAERVRGVGVRRAGEEEAEGGGGEGGVYLVRKRRFVALSEECFDAVTTLHPAAVAASSPLPLLSPANLTPDVWGLLGAACQDE